MRTLEAAVEKRLHRRVFVSAAQAAVLIEGSIEPTSNPPGWHARMHLTHTDGTAPGNRDIRSDKPSCRSLDESLILAIALMIDPDAPPPPPPPPPPGWQVHSAVGSMFGWGFLPGFGAGVLARVGLHRERTVGLEFDVRFWPPQASVQRGFFWSVQGGFAVCPLRGGEGAMRFTACTGATLAGIHATFPYLPHAPESIGFRVDVTLQARISRRLLGPVIVDLGATLAVPAARPAFYSYRNIPVTYVAGSADVGVSLEFP